MFHRMHMYNVFFKFTNITGKFKYVFYTKFYKIQIHQ